MGIATGRRGGAPSSAWTGYGTVRSPSEAHATSGLSSAATRAVRQSAPGLPPTSTQVRAMTC